MPWRGRPPRCQLVNLSTLEVIQCQFNPETLRRVFEVTFARLSVPGMDREILQYVGTANQKLPDVKFEMDKVADPAYDVSRFEGFLRALTLPTADAEGVRTGGPPRCLFVWPGVLSIETNVLNYSTDYVLFFVTGVPRKVTASVQFEEFRTYRLSSSDAANIRPLLADEVDDYLTFTLGIEGV